MVMMMMILLHIPPQYIPIQYRLKKKKKERLPDLTLSYLTFTLKKKRDHALVPDRQT